MLSPKSCSHLKISMTVGLHLVGLLKTLIKLGTLLYVILIINFSFRCRIKWYVFIQYPDSESTQARCWKINDESTPQPQGIKLTLHAMQEGSLTTRLGWRPCLPSGDSMTLCSSTQRLTVGFYRVEDSSLSKGGRSSNLVSSLCSKVFDI